MTKTKVVDLKSKEVKNLINKVLLTKEAVASCELDGCTQCETLQIEGISIKKLSQEFIDWYFSDDTANSIINKFIEQGKQAQRQTDFKMFQKMIDDYPNWFYEIDDPFFEKDYSEDELLDKLMNMLKVKLNTKEAEA